jgi:hypothetical protein
VSADSFGAASPLSSGDGRPPAASPFLFRLRPRRTTRDARGSTALGRTDCPVPRSRAGPGGGQMPGRKRSKKCSPLT